MADVVRFWMKRGADGFRLDTANYYAYDRQLRDNPKRPENSELMEDGQEANPLSQYITKYSKDRPENLGFIHFLRKIFNEKGRCFNRRNWECRGLGVNFEVGNGLC